MKKVLMLVLAFFIILPAVEVSAAYVYVPDFYNTVGQSTKERIRFLGMNQKNDRGVNYTEWNYVIVDRELANMYMDMYISKISQRYDFHLITQGSKQGVDIWIFEYTGNQAQYLEKFRDRYHVLVVRRGYNVTVNMVAGMYPGH